MRLMIVVAVAACVASLSGCKSGEALGALGSEEDGLRCDLPQVGDRVHVEIRYADDGRPSAVPDECRVAPGTRITWLGPDDGGTPFALSFPGGSPARDARGELRSDRSGDRQKVVIVAGDAKGTYKYEIAANGIVVDPAIIIR